ncbi:hypothetical protein SKTS_14110 [Sulfurimicrobium lacus]|uniref:CHAT domain-containing protein n=2 Tax=Sulfurimicrobium lacus TaxID=2715678 RepID=A0A6F8VCN9_9PROT|nr:hypothetical protein SKTS_14110 [Sulfurimicrobium lacus]
MEGAKVKLGKADFAGAEKLARQALDFARVSFGDDAFRVANACNLLGKVLNAEGHFAEAEGLFRQAAEQRRKTLGEEDARTANSFVFLGKVLAGMGKLAEAEQAFQEALRMQQRYRAQNDPDIAKTLNSLAKLNIDLGHYTEAESGAKKALQLVQEAYPGRKHPTAAKSLRLLAMAVAKQPSHLEEAESYARRALAMEEALSGPDHPDTARNLNILGNLLLQRGQVDEAEPLLRRALASEEKMLGADHADTAKTMANLARLLAGKGRHDEAETLFRNALDIARNAGQLQQQVQYARQLGRFLAKRGRTKEALVPYREAVDTLDRLYASTRGLAEDSRESFIAQYAPVYREMVDLLLHLNQLVPQGGYDQEALAVVSRTQSRLFTDLMRQADVATFAGDNRFTMLKQRRDELLVTLTSLRQVLATSASEADAEDDSENDDTGDTQASGRHQRKALLEHIHAAETELKQADDSLWQAYPRFMELVAPRPVTVTELQQKLLHPGEALVSFYLLPDKAVLFAVTPQRFTVTTSDAGEDSVAQRVLSLRQAMTKMASGAPVNVLRGFDPSVLASLYHDLFAPMEGSIGKTEKVFVAADGPLYTLPLEMLVTRYEKPEHQAFIAARKLADGSLAHPLLAEYATLSYLGQQRRFAYLPSLAALASLRQHPKSAPKNVLSMELVAFGDPLYAPPSKDMSPLAPDALPVRRVRAGSSFLPPLPETADEVRQVAALIGGKSRIFLEAEAQEHTVKTLDLRNTRYLLFATHGLLGGDYPGTGNQPALALTMTGDLQGEDGLLTMKEVLENLDLGARLVVLSACNTVGEGSRAARGEGFAGLTRAFMYAGAKGLVVSHWSVESSSTDELVKQLFTALREGQPPWNALDSARHKLAGESFAVGKQIVSRAHPYFWAPFVFVGD